MSFLERFNMLIIDKNGYFYTENIQEYFVDMF